MEGFCGGGCKKVALKKQAERQLDETNTHTHKWRRDQDDEKRW